MPSADTHTRELQARGQPVLPPGRTFQTAAREGASHVPSAPGLTQGLSRRRVGCLKPRCIARYMALRVWTPSGQASDCGSWGEVSRRGGQITANRLGRGQAAGSGSTSSPSTGRASGSTRVWDPRHQSKGNMNGPPEVAFSLCPGSCSSAGWDLRRQRCGSRRQAEGQGETGKELAFPLPAPPSSPSPPSPRLRLQDLLLSSPLPRTQLPERWAWGRLLAWLISLPAASRPAQGSE